MNIQELQDAINHFSPIIYRCPVMGDIEFLCVIDIATRTGKDGRERLSAVLMDKNRNSYCRAPAEYICLK